jgi:hypothetical protein
MDLTKRVPGPRAMKSRPDGRLEEETDTAEKRGVAASSWQQRPIGNDLPVGWSALRCHSPAVLSWSRSTAAGEVSGLFSLARSGCSCSWRATVRLATIAAMATRLTPKVRIGPPYGGETGASIAAPRSRIKHFPCRFSICFYNAPSRRFMTRTRNGFAAPVRLAGVWSAGRLAVQRSGCVQIRYTRARLLRRSPRGIFPAHSNRTRA